MNERELLRIIDRLNVRVAALEQELWRRPGRMSSTPQVSVLVPGKVKAGSSIPKNGSGTVVIWKLPTSGGGIGTATTIEIPVIDIGQVSGTVAAGKIVTVGLVGDKWILVSVEC